MYYPLHCAVRKYNVAGAFGRGGLGLNVNHNCTHVTFQHVMTGVCESSCTNKRLQSMNI